MTYQLQTWKNNSPENGSNIFVSSIPVFSYIIWTAFTYAFEDKGNFYT